LKNFSSLKAIISGLQSNPVYRLRRTWQSVPREKLEIFEELVKKIVFSQLVYDNVVGSQFLKERFVVLKLILQF
jgi:hypothetical protein